MTVLILGPNESGKSAYAEKLSVKLSMSEPYYVATMIPYGTEGQARVEKHRKQRESMGFITIEKAFHISDIQMPPTAAVLLEDVSNLLSNAMFDGNRDGNTEAVFDDITALCGKCHNSVLVSIDGLSPKPKYNAETRDYIDSLNSLNTQLSEFADTVISMRDGEPVFVKGNINAPD